MQAHKRHTGSRFDTHAYAREVYMSHGANHATMLAGAAAERLVLRVLKQFDADQGTAGRATRSVWATNMDVAALWRHQPRASGV